MNRRPTDEQLGQLLKTPHFGSATELPPGDPVTRRPGEERYMVESGGNTRLQILNELYNETGDDSFHRIHVLYRPWRSETHVLTAHLIENEKRGDMLFIDKALAVRELKEMYEAADGQSYSKRALAQRLKDEGFPIDLAILSRMDYAVDILLPVIPEALRAGMGRPQIERIRRLEKAYRTYWTDLSGQDEAAFDDLFQACLAENNRAEWDNDALRITTEERIAALLTIPVRAMRLDIDALLHGRTGGTPSLNEPPPQETASRPAFSGDKQVDEAGSETVPGPPTPIPADETTPATTATADPAIPREDSTPPLTGSEETDEAESEPHGIAQGRHHTYKTALELATRYQLEECIRPSFDWGLGFLVDLPGGQPGRTDAPDRPARLGHPGLPAAGRPAAARRRLSRPHEADPPMP